MINKLKKIIRKNEQISKVTMDKINKIVDSDSYYHNLNRKEREERISDNIKWYKEWGFVNSCYNEYGLDIKDFRNQDDYLERYKIKKEKFEIHHVGKSGKGRNPRQHIMMTINKSLFYSYMEKIAPGKTPKMHLIFLGNRVLAPVFGDKTTSDFILSLPNGKYVCKPSSGQKGNGFYIITKSNDDFVINGDKITKEEFFSETKKTRYLLQDFIIQHNDMKVLSPSSVNTIRIVTTRWNNKTHIFCALVRLSAREDALIDNASQGGTFIGVDEDTGKLRKYGRYFYQKIQDERHPISDIKYEGYQIPFWEEILDLVKKIHPLFDGLSTVGWDVAITENGPVILEANSNYCTKMAQMANGGLKERWYMLKEK